MSGYNEIDIDDAIYYPGDGTGRFIPFVAPPLAQVLGGEIPDPDSDPATQRAQIDWTRSSGTIYDG